jgi:acylphosphatase
MELRELIKIPKFNGFVAISDDGESKAIANGVSPEKISELKDCCDDITALVYRANDLIVDILAIIDKDDAKN